MSSTLLAAEPTTALPSGTPAPDFSLANPANERISLSQFRGRPVILAFYPADWSGTCGSQLALYNEVSPEFQAHNAELLGISVDGRWCHKAYTEANNFGFTLLADFEPKGEVARAYGVYRPEDGFSERALFVIDADGIIRWSYLSPIRVNPGADGIFTALEALENEGGQG